MFKNYLKVAIRNIQKSRVTAVINILGLAVGMACCMLIYIFVQNELSYDKFHKNSDRILRVLTIDKALGVSNNLVGITYPPLGKALKEEFPEVKEAVRINLSGRNLVTYKDQNFYTENLVYAEPSLFTVFDFELKEGKKGHVLSTPYTAVLTETMAKKTFGVEDPIGKTITLDNQNEIEVVGIMEDVKDNSHLKFDVMVSLYPTQQDSGWVQWLDSWNSISMSTYILLDAPESQTKVDAKLEDLIRKKGVRESFNVTTQRFEEAHLQSSDILFDGLNQEKGQIGYVKTLTIVAIFVILIASFNFMNLSTAQSSKRAKEVSMRKILGSNRGQLIFQYIGESIFLSFLSLSLACILVAVFGSYAALPIESNPILFLFSQPENYIIILGGTLLLGIISGIYPAVVLSGFQPIKIVKGKFTSGKKGVFLRRVLVVLQFAVSIGLIIGTTIVFQQLDYIKNKNLGFDKDQIINLRLANQELQEKAVTLKNKLEQISGIEKVAFASSLPGQGFGRRGIVPEGYSQDDDPWIVSIMSCNEDYFSLMNMEISAGRNFSPEFGTEREESIIINEAAAEAIGWDDPIGKKVQIRQTDMTVVGVVKDFHFTSMRHKIEPILISYLPEANNSMVIKIKGGNIPETIAQMEEQWAEVNPALPMEYTFFDEDFGNLYQSDEVFSLLIINFTWLAIFIACLGLFGLASFIAEQRTKEIGIRKVLGSKISAIVVLLSSEFVKLVLISNLIAWPIAYFAMENWLQDFQYKIDIGFGSFLMAAFLALFIALATVSYHSIKAAWANPVNSLRSE
ncbi:ABC transporter permease [Flexithrix dorotheae]|uniref:ABC transporter permease n=1 Tax=Flexithrix dorotheae TaxID=70993 RepID=UPI00036C64A4|nr:ABC transporter permease [Flexithrix dorotheae]